MEYNLYMKNNKKLRAHLNKLDNAMFQLKSSNQAQVTIKVYSRNLWLESMDGIWFLINIIAL